MLSVTGAIVGEGLGGTVALLTDGRFSGATHGFTVPKSDADKRANTHSRASAARFLKEVFNGE